MKLTIFIDNLLKSKTFNKTVQKYIFVTKIKIFRRKVYTANKI